MRIAYGSLVLAAMSLSAVGCLTTESENVAEAESAVLSLPATELVSGDTVTGVAGRSVPTPYGFSVQGPSRLMFDVTGGTDAQIFLAKDRLPTAADFDRRVGFGTAGGMNLQTDVGPGEWYFGIRDVNLDYPFPADPYSFVASMEPAGTTPPLALDMTAIAQRETSNIGGQVQYFTFPITDWTVVDVQTSERFGSGNSDIYAVFNAFPVVSPNGGVFPYTWASGNPGNDDKIRAFGPIGTIVVALYGPQPAGYENVILSRVIVPMHPTYLEDNKAIKVSGTSARHFIINVPLNQSSLTISTQGGLGASKLSASDQGPIVSTSIFPNVVGNFQGTTNPNKPTESTITIQNPIGGDYMILLEPEGPAGYTDVTLKARSRK